MKHHRLFRFAQFIGFFGLTAFIVSCNFLLFLHFIPMQEGDIRIAARVTFANVIFLTALFCAVHSLVRYFTVTRPVRKILAGIGRIEKGDFSSRIPYSYGEDSPSQFDRIAKGLNLMAEELGSLETLRTDFVSNVSHELKTPLAVMQNYAVLLQSPGLTETERLDYARAITGQTQRLSLLITNILRLNRLENQKIFAKKDSFDLGEFACECMLGFEQAWEEKGLEISTDIGEELMVESDRELLSLVLNNLISNAIKFTPEGGTVGIGVRRAGARAEFSVEDSGCGIDAKSLDHIFDKFYQADRSRATQGNGLGLALVKRVADILSLGVLVQSELGRGSRFSVSIPLARRAE